MQHANTKHNDSETLSERVDEGIRIDIDVGCGRETCISTCVTTYQIIIGHIGASLVMSGLAGINPLMFGTGRKETGFSRS